MGKQFFCGLTMKRNDHTVMRCDGYSTYDPLETLRETVLSCAPVSYLATEDQDTIGILMVSQKPFGNLGEMKILWS